MNLTKVSFRSKLSLLLIVLIGVSALLPCSALAQSVEKIDIELRKVLETTDPSELIAIIIIFQDKPTEDQLNILKTVHKMEISYVYKIINGVAGKAPAGEIPKIAEYDWVKGVWLDKKVYATTGETVETSKLIENLQKENEELKQNINELQEQVNTQQSYISKLEINLKIYSIATFIAGLIVGIGMITWIIKQRRASSSLRTERSNL
jgi:hypothetical protein